MNEKSLETYLNDHLGGAMLGSDLAAQIRDQADSTALSEVMSRLAVEIEEDRETLVGLMDDLGVSRDPVKQVGGWLAEKASRIKFSGAGSGDPDQGLFTALEALRLGVAGKKCLWLALHEVRDQHAAIANIGLDALIERAGNQELELERQRISAAVAVLS